MNNKNNTEIDPVKLLRGCKDRCGGRSFTIDRIEKTPRELGKDHFTTGLAPDPMKLSTETPFIDSRVYETYDYNRPSTYAKAPLKLRIKRWWLNLFLKNTRASIIPDFSEERGFRWNLIVR